MKRLVVRVMMLAVLAAVTLPGSAWAWWNDEWRYRLPLVIDTSAAGAAITESVGTVPVLVRLHAGNFKFEAAKEDGSDLRFVAGDDATPLKFHLEKWDGLLGEAFAWVRIPDLKPGAKTTLWLYYGNGQARPAEDASGSFDPETVLAWHFAERNQPVRDWTAWGHASTGAATVADGALIGSGLKLDGHSPVTIAASPALAWAEGGTMSWSAWVRPGLTGATGVLLSRRDGARGVEIGLENGLVSVAVEGDGGATRISASQPLSGTGWHHLAVTAGAGRFELYVDGQPAGRAAAILPGLTGPLVVGGAMSGTITVAADVAAARPGFTGEIDEMRLARVARPAGLIRVEALEQGADGARLLSTGPLEERASWMSGYMAVILGSVTFDGWVVIALLMVMAAISWLVMIDKAVFLGRLEKANRRFLDHYRAVGGDWSFLGHADAGTAHSLGGRLDAAEAEMVRSSSLLRLYQIGAEEVRGRMQDGRATLSAESIAAIRAALDSGQVQESERLNRMMVLLTIAISGGPFLGLLGTVVGVMITFAAIAASGDVNVNAIAPGIAAALVATVAGLAVAIPALFGYNWLLTRIRTTSATMTVFVDELVARLAEFHRHRGERTAPLSSVAE